MLSAVDFDEIQRRLESAQGDPQALALATLDIVLVGRDPRLRIAVDAAAIPHWFDAAVLAALLPEEAGDPAALVEQLKVLPMVESFQARQGWNVHDTTRLALRERLAREEPARFVRLSAAAASYFVGDSPPLEVERIYHRLSAAPEGADELEALWKRWDRGGRHEALQALGVVLDELAQTRYLATAAEARVCYCLWAIRRQRLSLSQQRSLAEHALEIFERIGDIHGAGDAHQALGYIRLSRGQLGPALEAYRAGQRLMAALAARDPDNTDWQHDLAASYNDVGDVLQDQGQLGPALEAYREGQRLTQALAARDPDNTAWQRDLAVSHGNVGDVLQDQRQLGLALEAYREYQHLMQALTARDPDNTHWQRELAVSYNNVGFVLQNQGQLGAAPEAYRQYQHLMQTLAARDPDNTDWQRELAVSHSNVGGVLHDQGQLDAALETYRQGQRLMQALTARDPDNTGWQCDLAVSHSNVGSVLQDQGQTQAALEEYKAGLQIAQRLVTLDPTNAQWQADLENLRQALVGTG